MSSGTGTAGAPRGGNARSLLRGGTPVVWLADRDAFEQEEESLAALSDGGGSVPRIRIEIVPDAPAEGPRRAPAEEPRAGKPRAPRPPGAGRPPAVPVGTGSRGAAAVEVLDAGGGGSAPAFTFDDVVRPLTTREFLRTRYRRKRPVLFRARSPRFASLCTWDELDAMLSSSVCRSRMRLVHDGRPVAARLWTTPSFGFGWRGRSADTRQLDGGRLTALLRKGATVILNGIDGFHPPVRPVADAIEAALGGYAGINLYASWMPTRGFSTHWDDHDVFVLQVAGRKCWRLYGETRRAPLFRDAEPAAAPREQVWSEALEAGDVLYVPRGWWHDARAEGGDGADGVGSLHLTCSVLPFTGLEFMTWLSGRLARHETFRRDLPHPADETGGDHFAALRELVLDELQGDVGRKFHDDLRATWSESTRTNLGTRLEPWKSPGWERYRIRLRGASRASLERNAGGDAVLQANGYRWTFDGRCMELLASLLRDGTVLVGAFRESASAPAPGEDPASFADELLRLLVTRGIAHASPPEPASGPERRANA